MKKPPFLSFYSLISGLLFSLAWPANGFPPLLFLAFVPLLLMEGYFLSNRSNNHSFGIFFRVWPAFIIWNGLTTWWIYNSTFFGVTMAVLINSVFMSLTFWLFHFMRRRLKNPSQGYLGLIFAWISFEFLHHHWDLNWPWLSLGNGFSAWPSWMQWYEFTGMFGGSLWVLVINILVYKVIQSWLDGTSLKIAFRKLWLPVAVMALPLAVSLLMYYTYREKTAPVDVVVVQPNIDPYEEQYELPADLVIEHATKLALTKADSLTDFVVFPESMVQPNWSSGLMIWENDLDNHPTINMFRNGLLKELPQAGIVVGYSTYRSYEPGEAIPSTARKFKNSEGYYDAFNTAFLFRNYPDLQRTHKSKLTPGVELMPFPWLLKPLGDFAIDLGGTVGQLGTDPERIPFTINDTLKISPVICYESVYGEFVAGFVRNGSNMIFVITNDGWWGNTAGHRQHALFSSVRAIETRRSVARSANTGISCFVNQRGDILQPTPYWETAVIRQKINANDKITLYVRYGDYIARGSVLGLVLLLLIAVSGRLQGKK
ncbi:MAG: apolipoprotein N-acyltransferase [Lentimicrobium sp.]|uniref:apolipoprotein N-acyltransferase n=1 Tax=Lentimicrobium sp. TaxID=2034841 RepID=UPI0025E09EEB|nr:apolipoprotein N-acyltransferase [Lentimicrobium sp.]MCO5257377.1 apolipoprotein N-acyltransferase [Lentimicrobium sp.]